MEWEARAAESGRRACVVAAFSIAAIVSDVLVALVTLGNWHAYTAAPKNAFTAVEDDPGYFLSGLVYTASSGARSLVLLGLAIAVARWRHALRPVRRSTVGASRSTRWWFAAFVAVGVEVCATWVASTQVDPTATGCIVKIVACLVNVLAAALLIRLAAAHRRRLFLEHGERLQHNQPRAATT